MKKAIALMLASVFVSPLAGAAEAVPVEEVVVERDGDELHDRLALPPPDSDTFDSALVFTNRSGVRAVVICHGFNDAGAPVGRVRVDVPGNGLRFALASDLAHGTDFLGRVDCVTGNLGVIGSAFLLGNGRVENLPTRSSVHPVRAVLPAPGTPADLTGRPDPNSAAARRAQTITIPVTLTL